MKKWTLICFDLTIFVLNAKFCLDSQINVAILAKHDVKVDIDSEKLVLKVGLMFRENVFAIQINCGGL